MGGIDILNKTEILDTPVWVDWMFCVMLVIFCVGFLTFLIAMGASKYIVAGVSICLMIATFVCWGFAYKCLDSIETGRYRYEVTIDDSVSFLDLQEKYDVVEQNGRIWTLEDKEAEE